ncbi:MAG: NAD(P)-dependent oxidoreductase, partial [Clostridia bacterium]|nr:NAD(P)-dependent oxidoreductase [Clostridia bacterium]
MKIAMTGVSGNMGREALKQTFELPNVEFVRIILRNTNKNQKLAKKLKKTYTNKIDIIFSSIDNQEACELLVKDVDYVVHMAAVIPPLSDNAPQRSYTCNRNGTIALVNAIKKQNPTAKYIHISTIAVYGNRNEKHPFGRVGDPLVISPFDSYAKDKLYAERYVLEAELQNWVVLRQTAMLHPNLFKDNISDGLMFHTALNAPLEWVTSRDSGYLIKNILERDTNNEVPEFWKQIYNIGGGYNGRCSGYDTINDGFSIIGGSIEKFFKPNYFSARNFHGIWMADGDKLNELFHYQRDGGHKQFWLDVAKDHPIFVLGKLAPKCLLNLFLFNRLLNDDNSPYTW